MSVNHTIDGVDYVRISTHLSGNSNDNVMSSEVANQDGSVGFYNHLHGWGGDDTITVISDRREHTSQYNNTGDAPQRHVYGDRGDDTINLEFASNAEDGFHQSIHAQGGLGSDTFNFQNIASIETGMIYAGRIEDFDPSLGGDTISVEGADLDLNNLPDASDGLSFTARIIELNGGMQDSTMPPQQWLLIEINGGGHILYALEGARFDAVRTDNNGVTGVMEFHFITKANLVADAVDKDANFLDAAGNINFAEKYFPTVSFRDPQQWVPYEEYENEGYNIVGIGTEENGRPNTVDGDQNNDNLNDVINTLAGKDVVHGHGGNDLIAGGGDADILFGDAGHDKIWGGRGADTLYGGTGNDSLFGGMENDWLVGGAGADTLDGGTGVDTADYSASENRVWVRL